MLSVRFVLAVLCICQSNLQSLVLDVEFIGFRSQRTVE